MKDSIRLNGIEGLAMATAIGGEIGDWEGGDKRAISSVILSRNEAALPHGGEDGAVCFGRVGVPPRPAQESSGTRIA